MKNDKSTKQMYKDMQQAMSISAAINGSNSHVPKCTRIGKRENWVPVWPQLDHGYDDSGSYVSPSMILNSSTRPVELDTKTYSDLDISSLRRVKGER